MQSDAFSTFNRWLLFIGVIIAGLALAHHYNLIRTLIQSDASYLSGSAALAGTSFNIDRHMTAAELGFARPTSNSLDAVSDRDFALEFLSVASICAMHLSRFAEELVIWSSAQFRFVTLSDQMPI